MAVDGNVRIPGTSLGVRDLVALLPGEVRGLLLYGSRARGTQGPESDVDILQLSNLSGRTLHIGSLAISRYDDASLRSMMTRGSIFGRHLRNEGVLLWDKTGDLRNILDSFKEPASYDTTLEIINFISQALRLPHDAKYIPGVHRAAIYCARTALYIASVQAGSEHFDTTRIAKDFGYDGFSAARTVASPEKTSYLLDIAQTLSQHGTDKNIELAPDFESAITQLSFSFPDSSQFLASLLNVREDLPYSTLSLPFA